MDRKPLSVNLLRDKQTHIFDTVVNWALTIGRAVVILTEFVALAAFLYRFVLDAQIIDLRDKIKGQSAIANAFAPAEKKFRNLQDRLALAKIKSAQGMDNYQFFTEVLAMAPNDVRFNSVSMLTDKLRIEANVQSVGAFSSFVANLKKNSLVKSVSIDKIENRTANSKITASITVTLKKQQSQQNNP